MSAVRILLTCPYAWDAPGGVQVHVRELGERLRARGHEVGVLTPSRARPPQTWVRAVGRPVAIPYNASVAPICPWPWSAARVRRLVRSFRPDVVHAHEPFTASTSLFATLWSPAPVVATFHSGADRSRLFDMAAPLLRGVDRRIAIRVAVSERAAAFVHERLGGGFEIVPNGIDVARFDAAVPADLGPGRWALFVGRLDERKGFPTAVRAFARLAERFPELHLAVAGEGPDAPAVDELSPDARARVRMLGRVRNEDLPPFHLAAELLVAPSVGGESFGMVVAEAMAARLPVVASDIPGYREVVRNGTDGLLVPPHDPGALAEAVARILGDPGLAGSMAGSAYERARERYDWEVVAGRLEETYERAVRSG